MAHDPVWDGDKGSLGPYEYTIRNARFGHVERDRGTKLRLIFEGEARGENGPIEWNPDYPCGAAETWETDPSGTVAQHVSVPDKNFHANSGVMEFVRAAIAVGAPLKTRGGSPREASIYTGLKFRLERKVVSTFTPDGEERTVEVAYDLPVEYLGEVGMTGNGAPVATPATPATPAPTPAPVAGGAGDVDLQLAEIAKTAKSFFDWANQATNAPFNLPFNDPRLARDTGIWAQVRGTS